MKRLFQVNTNPVQYFDSKEGAKKARGPLVKGKDDRPDYYEYTVSKGPDHHKRAAPTDLHGIGLTAGRRK